MTRGASFLAMKACLRIHEAVKAHLRRSWRALIAVLMLSCGAVPLSAQTQYGSIRGTVTDQSDAALPGATVTLMSPALLVPQTSVTDGGGVYRFEQLPVGTY